ncbi:CcdC family protein [Oceanobacillus bengalensis]|uniref:Cytochrome c biogenesis protein CcdC n=1 Tax=Oceanobacillus bengalensis TaxID=1435466 RepID=A0A494Z442_9BACI|nr:cytochrome c biogenesis protein CcdC [Oceanobacillus bengalensis]RKQ17275.1 cytochrome c biogenesis protein CcdC [Oceanobacillus bengalensis]
MFYIIGSTVVFAFMATMMVFIRLKASKKPASIKKIILPPIMMSTGAFMFLFPVFQIQWIQVVEALIVGAIFSILLIKTSKFEIKGGNIYLTPSRVFPIVLLGLIVVRLIIKLIVGSYISLGETTGMFFILALGMILTWRTTMLIQYLQIRKEQENAPI